MRGVHHNVSATGFAFCLGFSGVFFFFFVRSPGAAEHLAHAALMKSDLCQANTVANGSVFTVMRSIEFFFGDECGSGCL